MCEELEVCAYEGRDVVNLGADLITGSAEGRLARCDGYMISLEGRGRTRAVWVPSGSVIVSLLIKFSPSGDLRVWGVS